jgi:hypothetical protein
MGESNGWSRAPFTILPVEDCPTTIQDYFLSSFRLFVWIAADPEEPEFPAVVVTPDGRSYFYNYLRVLSELYVVDGLK